MTVDREFFLGFTGADRSWAEWLLAELDAADKVLAAWRPACADAEPVGQVRGGFGPACPHVTTAQRPVTGSPGGPSGH